MKQRCARRRRNGCAPRPALSYVMTRGSRLGGRSPGEGARHAVRAKRRRNGRALVSANDLPRADHPCPWPPCRQRISDDGCNAAASAGEDCLEARSGRDGSRCCASSSSRREAAGGDAGRWQLVMLERGQQSGREERNAETRAVMRQCRNLCVKRSRQTQKGSSRFELELVELGVCGTRSSSIVSDGLFWPCCPISLLPAYQGKMRLRRSLQGLLAAAAAHRVMVWPPGRRCIKRGRAGIVLQ